MAAEGTEWAVENSVGGGIPAPSQGKERRAVVATDHALLRESHLAVGRPDRLFQEVCLCHGLEI